MAIESEDELRRIYGEPSHRAARKVLDHLDRHARAFIACSPFFVLATGDGRRLDVSPKGDAAGRVIVEDDGRHLLIGDRPGNNRIDGLVNVLAHPGVAVLFLIPGVRETLRVNGQAKIHADADLLDRCAVAGKRPLTVLRVAVEESFLHCAKAFMRSRLWEPDSWPEQRPVPGMGEMLRDQLGGTGPAESEDDMLDRYSKGLY